MVCPSKRGHAVRIVVNACRRRDRVRGPDSTSTQDCTSLPNAGPLCGQRGGPILTAVVVRAVVLAVGLCCCADRGAAGPGDEDSWRTCKIAFQSLRDGISDPTLGRYCYQIYTMDADGKNQKRLTKGITINVSHEWSPDGKKLVFRQTSVDKNAEICVVNADGSGWANLSNCPGWNGTPT